MFFQIFNRVEISQNTCAINSKKIHHYDVITTLGLAFNTIITCKREIKRKREDVYVIVIVLAYYVCITYIISYIVAVQVPSNYRTRRFIGEELILAIGDFSENSPILNPPTLILCHKDTPTKLHAYAILLRTRGWNGRGTEWLLIVNFKIVRIPPI